MKKTALFAMAILIVCSLTDLGQAAAETKMEIVSNKQVKVLRAKVYRQYDWDDVIYPHVLVKDVSGKLGYSNVNGLLRNWLKIPKNARDEIITIFNEAGLGRFVFLMFVESGADPDEESFKGAQGLFQIMPGTAEAICGITRVEALRDPVINAWCAVEVLKKYGAKKNWRWALVKYNGKYRSCAAKGYMKCLHEKYLAGNKDLYGAAHYQAHFLIYSEMGRHFIWDWEKPEQVARK